MATKIRPIVFRINEPEGFVMNASNAQYNTHGGFTYLYWDGPAYPNGYDGNGKQCTIVNSGQAPQNNLMYTGNDISGGPVAINVSDLVTGTITMSANVAGTASGYGKYFCIPFRTEEEAHTWAAGITITILDP